MKITRSEVTRIGKPGSVSGVDLLMLDSLRSADLTKLEILSASMERSSYFDHHGLPRRLCR